MRIWLLKMIQYNGARVVVGGTFDLFHKGHRLLIKKAFEYAGKNPSSIVTIGLTSDKTASKKSHIVQPFTVRERQIRNFIAREKYQAGYVIQSLDNPEGDLLSNPDYDFFIASKETEENAKKVLALRNNTDLPPIIPNLIEVVTDGNGRISSTRLRKEMRSN
jgi:pantetheine-phosphate adenylyltransferase